MCLPSIFYNQVHQQLFNLNSSKPFNPSFRKKDYNMDALRENYDRAVIAFLQSHNIFTTDINKSFDKVWSIVMSIQILRQKNEFKKSQREAFKEIWDSYKDKISPYISQRITEYAFEKTAELNRTFVSQLNS